MAERAPAYIALDRLLSTGRPPGTPVAVGGDSPVGFAEFAARAAAWRNAFAAHGGRRFALYFDDSAAFATALFGAWHAGVCVYLPSDVLPATLARLGGEVDGYAGDIPGVPTLAPRSGGADAGWQPLDPAATALVLYTSGSTGEPSAIAKRLAQLFDEVASLAACFDSQLGTAQVMATVSHQHIYGLLFRVLWPLASGRPFAVRRLVFTEDIATALATDGPHAWIASPAHLKRLSDSERWAPGRDRLRAVFSSGGPLPADAVDDCRRLLGQAPIEVYGSTETGGVAWRQRGAGAHGAWTPLPGVAVRVVDERLQVASPHLAEPGWHVTADRVRAVGDDFELIGRTDRIVKIEEKRVSLAAMESALVASGWVSEARVLTLPGARLLTAVVAVPNAAGWEIVDREGKRALNERLRAALASAVEASVLPRRWRHRWALPQDAQGKTTELALRALFDPRRPPARLRKRSPHAAELELEIAATLPYFDGHFPIAPILPGVAQLQWAIELGRELFELPPAFRRMEALKFRQVITPGMTVALELTVKDVSPRADAATGAGCANPAMPRSGGERVLTFQLTSSAGPHASGRIVFGAAP